MKRLALIAMLMFTMAGCQRNCIKGVVTAKTHRPASTDIVMIPMTTMAGNASFTTFIPISMDEPERWVLTVEPYDAEGKPLKVQSLLVKQQVYDAINLGEWFEEAEEKLDTTRAKKVDARR